MWPALEGLIGIIALILAFGIISLPPRKRSGARSRWEIRVGETSVSNRKVSENIDVTVKISASGNRESPFPTTTHPNAAREAAERI
jgi:hypothetical protein